LLSFPDVAFDRLRLDLIGISGKVSRSDKNVKTVLERGVGVANRWNRGVFWVGINIKYSNARGGDLAFEFLVQGKERYLAVSYDSVVMTSDNLKKAREIASILEESGFPIFLNGNELINREGGKASLSAMGVRFSMKSFNDVSVERFLDVSRKLGTGKVTGAYWNASMFPPEYTSEERKNLYREIRNLNMPTDQYLFNLKYTIENPGGYDDIRAFCKGDEDYTHIVAKWSWGKSRFYLGVSVAESGLRYMLQGSRPLTEEEFGQVEDAFGFAFDRHPL